jgi:four helix bundle protein
MRDFKTLRAWQKAHELTVEVYRKTKAFPREELYGLTSQIRRASVSIPSNIAEGCGRRSQLELARFIQIAIGSSDELEYQMFLARELGFWGDQEHIPLGRRLSEVRRMLTILVRRVQNDAAKEQGTVAR